MSVARDSRALILCVEDEADLLRDLVEELTDAGYRVRAAADGTEAIRHMDAERPDLVLCDIFMPFLDGFGVLAALRARGPERADVPFVFLTARSDPVEVATGKRLGADDYLVKPIDYDVLLATVEARLRQVARMRAGRPALPDADQLATRFGLTPAEARLGVALARGRSLGEAAAEFGVARSTVAFHLSNLFRKTDTSRQAELVALLLGRGR